MNFKEVKEVLNKNSAKCHAIHEPYISGVNFFELDLNEKEYIVESIKKSLLLANYLCETDNPVVVAHIDIATEYSDINNLRMDLDKYLMEFKELLIEFNSYIIENCPRVVLAIENLPRLMKSCPHTRYFSCELGQRIFFRKILTNINTYVNL